MHASVIDFLATIPASVIRGRDVLEVGSRDVNGSPRSTLIPHAPASYIGVDAHAGPGVDIVVPAAQLVASFGAGSFDVVVCTEMLEHAEDWRTAIAQMKAVLRPSGLLILTTRSPGFPYHEHPGDYWRFTLADFRRIFADMLTITLQSDPQADHPGVFLKAREIDGTGRVDLSRIHVSPVEVPK